jgi:peroxiredoxin
MTIKVGDRVPDGVLFESGGYSDENHCPTRPDQINVADHVKGKRIAIFGLPGAFTPTCSGKHLPGYLANYDKFKAKNVDEIWCVAVNDGYVMAAWGRDQKAGTKIRMLGDGNGAWTKALGLDVDSSGRHGYAHAALLDAGRRRRRQAAERRSARQVRSVGCRDDAQAAGLISASDGGASRRERAGGQVVETVSERIFTPGAAVPRRKTPNRRSMGAHPSHPGIHERFKEDHRTPA